MILTFDYVNRTFPMALMIKMDLTHVESVERSMKKSKLAKSFSNLASTSATCAFLSSKSLWIINSRYLPT